MKSRILFVAFKGESTPTKGGLGSKTLAAKIEIRDISLTVRLQITTHLLCGPHMLQGLMFLLHVETSALAYEAHLLQQKVGYQRHLHACVLPVNSWWTGGPTRH